MPEQDHQGESRDQWMEYFSNLFSYSRRRLSHRFSRVRSLLGGKKDGNAGFTYSIGFGPALWRKTINDIDYQLALFPLGGFVHIFG